MRKPVLARPSSERFAARAPVRDAVRDGRGEAAARRARDRQRRALSTLIRRHEVVWDVGAHHGLLSLLAARRVGDGGVVHAFEPSARHRWFLEHHVRWNGLRNVIVHPIAVGAFDGQSLDGDTASRTFAVGRQTDVIAVRTARTLVESGALPLPDVVRVDANGAEAEVLRGALATLSSATRMMVAIHSRAAFDACAEMLGRYDYRVVESQALQAALDGDRWSGDPDFVCFGPAHGGWRRDLARLRLIDY